MNKRKYTIVQILPALNTGGVERGVVEISKALIENNFRSIVISSGGYMVSQITRNGEFIMLLMYIQKTHLNGLKLEIN